MKLLSKNLIMIFSFMDQFECIKLQTLCKDAYYVFFPKILKTFFLERQYVHLYVANTKSVVVAYLDNYKGREICFADETPSLPPRLKYFASLQYDNRVLLTGGMNSDCENPEDPAMSPQFDYCFAGTYEFNVKHGKCLSKAFMTEKRAKHCLAMYEDPANPYNKLVLAIGGVSVAYIKDPYKKQTRQRVSDLSTIDCYSLESKQWTRFNAKIQIARHSASASYIKDYIYVIGGHTVDLPHKFINTIERCHKSVPSSNFERLNIR
jgi:hypothetical protein